MYIPGERAGIQEGSITSSMLDPQLLTQITPLADGTVVNGVALFWRPTEPLTRIDGSSLVIGDLHYSPVTMEYQAWNGVEWVSINSADFSNITLTGISTTTTPPINSNDTTIANTEFVQSSINQAIQSHLSNLNLGAYSVVNANFIQPAVLQTVTVSVESTAWMNEKAYYQFNDGTNIGWYEVVSINSPTSVTIKNLGYPGSAIPSTAMIAGGNLVPTGGILSVDGNIQSTINSNFTQPTLNNNVTVPVTNAYLFQPGEIVTYTNGITTSTYQIVSVNNSSSLTLKSIDSSGFTAGTTVNGGGSLSSTSNACNCNNSFSFEYNLAISVTTSSNGLLPNQLGVNGSFNGGSIDPITELYFSYNYYIDPENETSSLSKPETLSSLGQNSIVRIFGKTSKSVALYRLDTAEYNSDEWIFSVTLIDTNGDWIDGERVQAQFISSPTPFSSFIISNTTLDSIRSLRYFVNCSAGNRVLTLPQASNSPGISHLVKRIDNTANTLTVNRSSTNLIDTSTSTTIAGLSFKTFNSDGINNWYVS